LYNKIEMSTFRTTALLLWLLVVVEKHDGRRRMGKVLTGCVCALLRLTPKSVTKGGQKAEKARHCFGGGL
jgi:hypothetical protein